jgi:hypothetical protein
VFDKFCPERHEKIANSSISTTNRHGMWGSKTTTLGISRTYEKYEGTLSHLKRNDGARKGILIAPQKLPRFSGH